MRGDNRIKATTARIDVVHVQPSRSRAMSRARMMPFLFSFRVNQGPTARFIPPSASTSNGDDEVYFFSPSSRRAILGTLPACVRSLAPARLGA
jgi:hypothetical protein